MRAWLPERELSGPERATERDIEGLNKVFAEAFTDRYRRDGLVGVRVPPLNPVVWRFALLDAGEGALVWRDARGHVAAFNGAHRCGSVGWMGPLGVRPDRKGQGIGQTIVRAAVDVLLDRGVTTLGLETMPRTVDNIGFYAGLGFAPGYLTVTMTRDVPRRGHSAASLLSDRRGPASERAVHAARDLAATLSPGADYTHEILLTAELELGDTCLIEGDKGLDAFVLWHSVSLAESRGREELRVLKIGARSEEAFDRAIVATEAAAAKMGIRRVAFRCQTAYLAAFRRLVERGYRVRWTDLRMTYQGYAERHPSKGVLFSNWEI